MPIYADAQRLRLGDVAVFENRQPVTAAKFITKSSLFILLLGFIRRLELKPISEQKVENIFVAPPYCQTACYRLALSMSTVKSPIRIPCPYNLFLSLSNCAVAGHT